MVPRFGQRPELFPSVCSCRGCLDPSLLGKKKKDESTTIASEDVEEMDCIDQIFTPSGLPENVEKNSLF